MKVLYISARADIGGGQEHMYQLISGLGLRVEAIVACPREMPYWERFYGLDNVSVMLEIPKRKFRLSALYKLIRRVSQLQVELIHSHGKGAGLYARLISALTKVPVVHTFHGLHIDEYNRVARKVYCAYEKLAGKKTAVGICVSPGERDQIARLNFLEPRKLRVIANGVRVPCTAAVKSPLPGQLVVSSVSRFNYHKNPDLIIKIAESLKDKIQSFQVVIAGRGSDSDETEFLRKVEVSAVSSNIILLGGVECIRDALRDSHVFLSTSRWEGLPLSVLEAMSEGVPCVVTDVVGNRDAVQSGISGYLFPLNEPGVAAEHIARLATDSTLWHRISSGASRNVMECYSVEAMARSTNQEYLRVLGDVAHIGS